MQVDLDLLMVLCTKLLIDLRPDKVNRERKRFLRNREWDSEQAYTKMHRPVMIQNL